MKKFIKKNLSLIIVVGIVLALVLALVIAIIVKANEKEPDFIVQENVLVKYQGDFTEVEIPKDVISVGQKVFANQTKITTIEFLDNKCQTLGFGAFTGCGKLTSITLPTSLKEIGSEAFSGCTQLENIVIPEGVESISERAFENCTSLKTITLPASLKHLGENVFYGCSLLENIIISSENTEYVFSDNVLYNKDQTEMIKYLPSNYLAYYTVPTSVKTIASGAFHNATSLTNLTIGDQVEKIGDAILEGCDSLVSLTIPYVGNSLTESRRFSFLFNGYPPTTLKRVTINGGKYLASQAFKNCSSITSINLPESLEIIEIDAFSGCSALNIMTIPSSVKTISSNAFNNCNREMIIYLQVSSTVVSTWDSNWNPNNYQVIYEN